MSDTTIILALGVLSALLVTIPFIRRVRLREDQAREANLEALRYGLHEPASLHPVIDPSVCIGIGSCISSCPEHDVLGMVEGQARAIQSASCVGHGLCEAACPVDAITLVFGTAERGVDLPRLQGNFETNVPGLYIIGELGGMGLIRNAFAQGRQCVDGIAKEIRRESGTGDLLDVLIVGCGPAGLAASLQCIERKLSFETLEREEIGGAVRHYPRKKLVMTEPVKVPGYGRIGAQEILKEQLIEVWEDVIQRTGLTVRTGETVSSVEREPDGSFTVTTDLVVRRARRVILAIGRRGVPRKLGVPGEDSACVAYSLREPEAYRDDRILVVGGGDSAVEAALSLAEQPGNLVRMSYRRSAFSRIKPANRQRVNAAIGNRAIDIHWETSPAEIQEDHVVLRGAGDQLVTVPSSQVFVFIGGELPTRFLETCGIEIDTKFGEALTR